ASAPRHALCEEPPHRHPPPAPAFHHPQRPARGAAASGLGPAAARLAARRTPLRPDPLFGGGRGRGRAVRGERHGVPDRHARRRQAGGGRHRRPGGAGRPPPRLRRRPLAGGGQGAAGGHGAADERCGPPRRDGGERRAAVAAEPLRPGFPGAGDNDGGVQRVPPRRRAPRPLAADRPRPRGRRPVPHDARLPVHDAQREPPRRFDRGRDAAKCRTHPLRPRPHRGHQPARPRSRVLRVLPRGSAGVRPPAREWRRRTEASV
ncbi:MAG: cAMP-binding proteins - catabolite gene activator and regulatory subunit of cAMP-dependent protein kinases, partial [uncultured Acetobacteraceae bacterium]